MNEDQYWQLGRQELICIVLFACIGAAFGTGWLIFEPAPPWWYLRGLPDESRWALYETQGGFAGFRRQSTIGWCVMGAVAGLVASNVVLRGKPWEHDS